MTSLWGTRHALRLPLWLLLVSREVDVSGVNMEL